MDVNETLKERGIKYGNYLDQSRVVLYLFAILKDASMGKEMEADQRDAMYMICVKLSRIVNGDPNYADNWHDIAGYATLVANRLKTTPRDSNL